MSMVYRIYKEDQYSLLHTKYESSGPIEIKMLLCFSHDFPGAGPVWTPGARLAGFVNRTFIHTCSYKQNRKALGLMVLEKKFFFYIFPIVSLWELMTIGAGSF